VWQFQDVNTPEKYVLTYFYLKTIDTLGLLDVLIEDGDHGVFTFPTGDTDKDGNKRCVSRDILDSVNELLFLEQVLQISRRPGLKVLDIGAGYGRLAYRAVTALSNIDSYFCIDAVPESTFISSYYLSRKGAARARVVAFDDQQDLVPGTIDLAVNIHSFSECAIEAVDYWISRCLFIVPNISRGEKPCGWSTAPTSVRYSHNMVTNCVMSSRSTRTPRCKNMGFPPTSGITSFAPPRLDQRQYGTFSVARSLQPIPPKTGSVVSDVAKLLDALRHAPFAQHHRRPSFVAGRADCGRVAQLWG
jgi:hypothetical protein